MRIQYKKILREFSETMRLDLSDCPFSKKVWYIGNKEGDFMQIEAIPERKPTSKSFGNLKGIYIMQLKEHNNFNNLCELIEFEFESHVKEKDNMFFECPLHLKIL